MSHQDQARHTSLTPNHQALKQALDWLLAPAMCSQIKFRDDCTWTPRSLIFTALLWAWSDEKGLKERFFSARKIVIWMLGLADVPASSYQAFLKMLTTWTGRLTRVLVTAFRRCMAEALKKRFLICGFAVFGVDGSRLELPRTRSNEQRFAPAAARRQKPKPRRKAKRSARARAKAARTKAARAQAARAQAARARQKKTNSPQIWLTLMWHVGTGLPWDWLLGPSDSSERDHLKQMIAGLVAGALVTADAGFVGYEYWKALIDSGRHLLIRVGANVRLLKDLGYYSQEKNGLVYLWPDREAARRQPPLVLRLVVASGGRHPVYLVTSVLDEKALSDRQIIEIYARRWGIELFYRHFKQTFERRKLRSQTADHAELEATWSLLGLWAMSLHAQVELAAQDVPAQRISVAQMLRAYRGAMRQYKSCPDPGESLYERLSEAVIDDYKRASKASRDYPRKKQGHAIGAPEVCCATKDQIETARQIKNEQATRLTA